MLNLETGAGTRNANTYVLVDFVSQYLADRERFTENDWSTATVDQQEAAIISATQYIDTRWGTRFKGARLVTFPGVHPEALISFSGVPVDSEIVTIGSQIYTFKSVLSVLGNNEVFIGVDDVENADNLLSAINGADGRGTIFSDALETNRKVTAQLQDGSMTQLRLTATVNGVSGNDIVLSTDITNLAIDSLFVNGLDEQPQALEFPRTGLSDRDGLVVNGIPLKLKHATAEYAVIAHANKLWQTPTVDDTGRAVTEKSETVGPIETTVKYQAGGSVSQLIHPYPAADKLLVDYIFPAGRVLRG